MHLYVTSIQEIFQLIHLTHVTKGIILANSTYPGNVPQWFVPQPPISIGIGPSGFKGLIKNDHDDAAAQSSSIGFHLRFCYSKICVTLS